jgi:hypothetical protein
MNNNISEWANNSVIAHGLRVDSILARNIISIIVGPSEIRRKLKHNLG